MSHELKRINGKRYFYYMEGGNLALVEQDSNGHYQSPTENVSVGLLIRYTGIPNAPTSEDSTIDCDPELAIALVEFVKAKNFENQGEYDKAMYHKKEFRRLVMQFKNNRDGGFKVLIPKKVYSIV